MCREGIPEHKHCYTDSNKCDPRQQLILIRYAAFSTIQLAGQDGSDNPKQ